MSVLERGDPTAPVTPDETVVIIGAGPCGLACARELDNLGHRNWLLLERARTPGGLAASVTDAAGFTWDLGCHVVFSHFGEFDALLNEVMGNDLLHHDRSSFIRAADRWVPYPFQNNLRHLPDAIVAECLDGLSRASGGLAGASFAEWMHATFGYGITRHFLRPYNFKVWATPAELMSADWIAERVAVVSYARAAKNVREGRDDVAWGPNNRFAFPVTGGTGEIYRRLAQRLGDRIAYEATVTEVDPRTRTVTTADRRRQRYARLISTMPLDRLVSVIRDVSEPVRGAASQLVHNGVFMVGVGYETELLDDRSWMYFPAADVPFYRATNFAKYSPHNVPDGDVRRFCSYMTETSYSRHKPVSPADLAAAVERSLRAAGVVCGEPAVASVHIEDIEYAYPVPTLGRDAALSVIQPWLMAQGILSRGRFGAWKYEMGNMDHAVKMGIDAARAVVKGAREELWAKGA